ncbi:MAG TPA: glucose-6-phosphate isomerase, partial [Dehalococcoidia bacterium]
IWRRDASVYGGDEAQQRSVANRLGWLDIASKLQREASVIEGFAREVREAGFTSAVLLGMGGSSLAPEVLRRSIRVRGDWPQLHVLDTTDPATIRATEREVDVARTLFFVSSKSGGTIEVASLFAYFYDRVRAVKGDRAGENFVAITDAGTQLESLAAERGFRRVFLNPSDIGGRYSALSYFGLVPAAVTGIDVERLLTAGAAADAAAHEEDSEALRLGAVLGALARVGRDKCTFVIAPGAETFGLWVEQLIAESTGKHGTGVVPVTGEPLGTPRHYGDDRLFVQLRLEGDSTGEQDSVIGALVNEGQPALIIDLDDEYDLGREFVRWEFATAVAGILLGINPFDEPNVQESKDNTARVLREVESSGELRFDQARVETVREPLQELLSRLASGDYLAITAYVRETEGTNAIFRGIRQRVRDECGVATTLGYGPRFLHSTGQLHKGGPPQGVFLQLTSDDREDAAIPGRPLTFGRLKRAQALGDLESLRAHGRPAISVNVGEDVEAGLSMLAKHVQAALLGPVGARR